MNDDDDAVLMRGEADRDQLWAMLDEDRDDIVALLREIDATKRGRKWGLILVCMGLVWLELKRRRDRVADGLSPDDD